METHPMESECNVFRHYARWLIAHRVLVGLAILGLTVFHVSRVGILQFDSNVELSAPQTHPYPSPALRRWALDLIDRQ